MMWRQLTLCLLPSLLVSWIFFARWIGAGCEPPFAGDANGLVERGARSLPLATGANPRGAKAGAVSCAAMDELVCR